MQAIAIRLGEIFNPTFSDNSFGYRPYHSIAYSPFGAFLSLAYTA
jgi:retron-type reverse transcriptase